MFRAFIIRFCKRLNKLNDNIYLVFLGSKHSSDVTLRKFNDLADRIHEKQLASKVSLLSEVKVEDVLNTIDIGVLVSEIEGVPNVVMEYMLYGLPVVTTNHPGCVTLLKDSLFLIENNEDLLFDCLEQLIRSESLRISEGESNQKKIKNFNINAYVNKLEVIMNKYKS